MTKTIGTITLTIDQMEALLSLVGDKMIQLHNEESPNTTMCISSKGLCYEGQSEEFTKWSTINMEIIRAKVEADINVLYHI